MVGYPKFEVSGLNVKAEWDPRFLFGSVVNVASVIPMAAGKWIAAGLTHDLSTLTPDGPWFTDLHLILEGFANARSN
jgi:hypothetical protein